MFKKFIDVSTLLIITIGLYFTYDQAKKINEGILVNNRSINLSTWSSITTQTLDIDKLFIEDPKMQKYIYQNVSINKDDPDFLKAFAIATSVLDYFDSILTFIYFMRRHIPENVVEADAWESYITKSLQSSPLMCQIIFENASSYGSETRRIALPACSINTKIK